jgi:hypothetical protein
MDPYTSDRAPSAGPPLGGGALAGLEALEAHQRFGPAPAPAPAPTPTRAPIPRAARHRIRRTGPIVALMLPGMLGVISLVMLRGSTSTTRGVGGFVMALLAAPLLPAFGAPLRTGSGAVFGAVAASAVLWFIIGAVAAHRATRHPWSGWGRFWGEYLWLAACVWLGALLAEVSANLVLGRVLV